MKLGLEPEKKKTQESEDERWARLDKRIERARARHELTCLGMGTIFLVSYTTTTGCMYILYDCNLTIVAVNCSKGSG